MLTVVLQCAGSEITESGLAPFQPVDNSSRKRPSAPTAHELGNMGNSADAPSTQPEPEVFFDLSQQSNKGGKGGKARRKVSYVQDPIHQKKQKLATRSTRSRLATMA
jgi:hypothetical protein